MFPALRVAYLVVPRPLVEPFRRARAAVDEHPPATAQPALAAFFAEGHLGAYLRRQRKCYAERQERLLELSGRYLTGLLAVAPDPAGLHVVARPVGRLAKQDDTLLSERLAEVGIVAPPLSGYYVGPGSGSGLLLGYAALPDRIMEPAMQRMAEVLAA
jgi:GntR family transcriptional regulator/MocR family aminotransferase